MSWGRCGTLFAAMLLVSCLLPPVLAQEAPTDATNSPDFIYRTQRGDTLIGFARRALIDPRRWPALQRLNRIANPRLIPIGTALRVPVAWLRQSAVDVEVIDVIGSVAVGGRILRVGDRLAEGTTLDTGTAGFVSLRTSEGAVVVLQSGSRIVLQRLRRYDGAGGHDTRLDLESGRAESDVPAGNRGRFEIITPVAIGAVRGTDFRVAFDGSDLSARTEVVRGTVAVDGQGVARAVEIAVPAGFGTRTDATGRTAPPVRLLPAPVFDGAPERFDQSMVRVSVRPVALAAGYRFQVAADADLRQIVAELASPTPSVEFNGLADGQYWLRVRAVDSNDLQGVDSVHRFELRARPLPPTLDTPGADAKQTGPQAHFRWLSEAPEAPYRLVIARDAAFADVAVERNALVGGSATLVELEPGHYYWRMAALRPDGTAGPWGETRAFSQKAPPASPELIELQPRVAVVSWAGEPGQSFRAQLAREPTFEKPLHDEPLAATSWRIAVAGPGKYYVRVQATDADGYVGPWSAASTFEVPAPRWIRWMTVVSFLPLLL
ncbi:MAG: FecR domain-containing protein [Steroidobacteraceae bacterium]